MNELRLILRGGQKIAIQNVRRLLSQIKITGSVTRPRFDGAPSSIADLQYWLAFTEWYLHCNTVAECPAEQAKCEMSQKQILKSIQRGFQDFIAHSALN